MSGMMAVVVVVVPLYGRCWSCRSPRSYRASRAVGQRLFPALLLSSVTSGLDKAAKIRRAEVFYFVDGSSVDEVHFGIVMVKATESFVEAPLFSV